MAKTYMVEIPEWVLIALAVHGNMGDGEVPRTMQLWAESECKKNGLQTKLTLERENRYNELKKRASNVWGSDVIDKVEGMASVAGKAIEAASKKKDIG